VLPTSGFLFEAYGAFVYRLGHGPLKAERRVRFPYALPKPNMGPFQIIFNPTSAAELASMPKRLQLEILGQFRGIPHEMLESDLEDFGKLEKAGKTLYRFRLGDYRIYFSRHRLGVVVHRILTRNTLKDFFYRSNFKMGEDQVLQENPAFWEQIESAGSSKLSE
jgi:mRNA-degrading endonuclease RelE of RelBE toxin-antitoxin system